MSSLAPLAATCLAGLWEGAASYVSFAHPVPYYHNKDVDTTVLLHEWRRMFVPAAKFQGSLDALGAVASAATAYLHAGTSALSTAFGTAALCQVLIFSYTMTTIMPLNSQLLPKGGVEGSKDEAQIRQMLVQWGKMHGVRTALGGVALGACLYGLKVMLAK